MSFDQTAYPGAANLLGNVEIPRNIIPLIRSKNRRLDPDGISSVPYYASANGKTIRISYTAEISTVVTPATVDVTLSGNGIATIINDINTAATSGGLPIQALDLDGFLAIRNVNPGKTHYLRIDPFTTPSSDAAPVLGFVRYPLPGGISFAGEVAATPGSRTQSNPQTTALLSKDDTLGDAELNRPLAAILQMVDNLRAEINRDVIVYRDIPLTFSAHATDGVISARINDDTVRVFYPKFPVGSIPNAAKDLNPYHRVLDALGNVSVQDTRSATFDPTSIQVLNFFYATSGTPFTPGAVFATWGTPDGGTIVSDSVPNKDKHAATSITSIVGNIITCSSGAFVTKKVMPGDPVELVASTLSPFDHSGWFAVDGVIDETHLAIRSMAATEETPNSSTKKPRWLNPLAGGTIRVAMGRFIPAGDLYVSTTQNSLVAGGSTHVVRLAIGVPFSKTLTDDRARDLSGGLDAVSAILLGHITASADAHAASAITGFTSATSWRDGTTIAGANLKQTIEDILTDLRAQSASNSGTGRIGAEVISIGGATPNTLAQGTILSQLTSLLTALQSHVTQSSGAHAASAISYAGGSNWADSTTNPATTVEGQLDKIITDLSGSGGAAKLGFAGSGAWADSTTNPATTIEAQLDKIVSDLSPSTGSAKIGGAASGTDISAGTLQAQVADLAVNWLKMSRANTVAAAQTFTAVITANGGVTGGTNANIKVVGTGRYGHDDMLLPFQAAFFQRLSGSFVTPGVLSHWEVTSGIGILVGSLVLPAGTRVRSFAAWGRKNGLSDALTVSLDRVSMNTTDFSDTTNNIGSTSDTSTGFHLSTTGSGTLNHVIDATWVYCLTATIPRDGIHFHGIVLTYDFPV